jgi:lipoprotein-anchoring transpeptidase ErfK/SrfK
VRTHLTMLLAAAAIGASAAIAQNSLSPESAPDQQSAWVPPGTPGSEIDGTLFHAQVLMSAHGFSPGVIDGKKGESFRLALRSFQESRGLKVTGELDSATRRALLEANRPSTVMVELTEDDVRGEYVLPFPKDPEAQAKLDFLGYRNMLEKVAERYHTTPATVVALNGPDKKIGLGQTLRLPNVVAQTGEYSSADGDGEHVMRVLNVDSNQPSGDYVVVDKSDGVLKVYTGDPEAETGKLVAAFPVTMGSKEYPLPLGTWKATTYDFLPPFKYQPAILNNPKSNKELDLPPGPNGPVGVAWLDFSKENYGIHGTGAPETIGRAQSHGCIRMTNWDVLRLSLIMKPGFKAVFQA